MAQSKHEYFHLGVINQKKADITVDLRRIDSKKMARWTPEQRRGLWEFMEDCEEAFSAFKEEIIKANRLVVAQECDTTEADKS